MERAGVYTTSMNSYTLDEAKAAYKGKNMIIAAIGDNIQITHFIRPVYNFKAEDSRML